MDQPANPFSQKPQQHEDNTLPTLDLIGDVTLPPLAPNTNPPEAVTVPQPPTLGATPPAPPLFASSNTPHNSVGAAKKINYFQENSQPTTPEFFNDNLSYTTYTHMVESESLSKGHKKRAVAIILLLFFGFFGAHNFYLKHYSVAIFQFLTGLFLVNNGAEGFVGTLQTMYIVWLVANGVNILRGAGRYSENF